MILKFYEEIHRVTDGEKANRINKYSSKRNTKYGIVLDNLPETYRSLLKNRLLVRYLANDDIALLVAFHCADIENDHKEYDKVFYLPHLDKFTTSKKIKYFNNIVKWKCSICEKEIKIDTSRKLKHQNLLCKNCVKKGVSTIDEKVIINYTKLSKYIIDKLGVDYKYLIKKIKKNQKS